MPATTTSTKGTGCFFLFLTPFFLVGCFTTFLIGQHFVSSLQMHNWPTAAATVLAVDVKEVSDGDGTSWEISAKYKYTYGAKDYSGDRIGIIDDVAFGGTFRKRARLLQDAQKAGRTVPCYVKPGEPGEAVLFPGVQWDHVFCLSIFSLVFGGAGAGGYGFLWYARRCAKQRDELKSLFPNEPWKWRPCWAQGVIPSGAKGMTLGLWAVAAFWNAVSAPIPFVFLEEWGKGNKLILLFLLFPLIGLGLLIAAIRASLVWLKYGRTELVMQSVPGVIGGELIGAIRLPQPIDFQDRVKLTLSCIKKVTTGRGDNRQTKENVLWQSEHEVDPNDVQVSQQTLILAAFTIPYTCQPTDEDKDVQWRLEASAPTAGVDFRARFEVPVFKTADSREDVTERSSIDPVAQAERMEEAARASRIYLHELADGSIELDVPPSVLRAPGMFLSLAMFTLFCIGACVVWIMVGAPVIVPIGIGLVILLLLLIHVQQLTGRTRSRVTAGSLEVASRFLCFWSRRTISADEVCRVQTPITSRAQYGTKHYAYYSVRIVYRQQGRLRNVDVAASIASKDEAQWIAQAVESALTGTHQP